jgi:hypothetical protein
MAMVSQAELIALRRLAEQPRTTMVMPDIAERLLAKGLVERHAGTLVVTSRGHAAILQSEPPPNAA